jgi:hypothetical protein
MYDFLHDDQTRAKRAKKAIEYVRENTDQDGYFEADPEIFADLIETAGAGWYDRDSHQLRVFGSQLSRALLRLSIETQYVEDEKGVTLDPNRQREEQPA